jgi:hypothetical protein
VKTWTNCKHENDKSHSHRRAGGCHRRRSLIVSRIQLIEELAPYAMDQVNADAFREAYKDLVNLVNGQAPQ